MQNAVTQAAQQFLTKKDICQRMAISPRTLDLWRAKHGLPTVKLGGVCRFRWDEVEAWFMRFSQRGEAES